MMNTTNLTYARILAIYWVVLWQHNFAPVSAWGWINGTNYPIGGGNPLICSIFTSITMPMCFFVSGAVFALTKPWEQDCMTFFRKKLQRILLPCMIFGCIFQLIKDHTLSITQIGGYAHMWFLWQLFICLTIAYVLQRIKTNFGGVLMLSLSLLIPFLPDVFHMGVLKNWTAYMPHFSVGLLLYQWGFHQKTKLRYTTYALALFLSIIAYIVNKTYSVNNVWLDIFIVLELLRYIPEKFSKYKAISFLNKTSFGVYIFHLIWLSVFYQALQLVSTDFIISNRWWITSLLVSMTIPFSYIATIIVKKCKYINI